MSEYPRQCGEKPDIGTIFRIDEGLGWCYVDNEIGEECVLVISNQTGIVFNEHEFCEGDRVTFTTVDQSLFPDGSKMCFVKELTRIEDSSTVSAVATCDDVEALQHMENLLSVSPAELLSLRWFGAGWMNFTDNDLLCINALPSLLVLDVSQRHLKAEQLFRRARYMKVTCRNNLHITDEGLANIGCLQQLRDLSMAGTAITDRGLAHLRSLRHLDRLDLGFTAISSDGLNPLLETLQLRRLDVNSTKVNELPAISNSAKLARLNLAYTKVSNEALEHVLGCQHLYCLDLTRTDVTDEGVSKLENLEQLRFLGLSGTCVTEECRTRLARALPKCTIDFFEVPEVEYPTID